MYNCQPVKRTQYGNYDWIYIVLWRTPNIRIIFKRNKWRNVTIMKSIQTTWCWRQNILYTSWTCISFSVIIYILYSVIFISLLRFKEPCMHSIIFLITFALRESFMKRIELLSASFFMKLDANTFYEPERFGKRNRTVSRK